MSQTLQRLRKARLLLPTMAALAGLAVLIGLGTWQMERKRWKEGLIAQIAARAHTHLKVEKVAEGERTLTRVSRVANAQREHEIARMLGGIEITSTTLEHARELLLRSAPARGFARRD